MAATSTGNVAKADSACTFEVAAGTTSAWSEAIRSVATITSSPEAIAAPFGSRSTKPVPPSR